MKNEFYYYMCNCGEIKSNLMISQIKNNFLLVFDII